MREEEEVVIMEEEKGYDFSEAAWIFDYESSFMDEKHYLCALKHMTLTA